MVKAEHIHHWTARSLPQGVAQGILGGLFFGILFQVVRAVVILVTGYGYGYKLLVEFQPFELLWLIFGMATAGALTIPAGRMLPASPSIRGLLLGTLAALLMDRPPFWFFGISGPTLELTPMTIAEIVATLGIFVVSGIGAAGASGRLLGWMPDRISVRSAPLYVVAFLLAGLGALAVLWLQALTFGNFG